MAQKANSTVTIHTVISVRHLTRNTFVLRFEKGSFEFISGQYLVLGIIGSLHRREYSIYSGQAEPFLEVLIKEVEEGDVSKRLKQCKPGEALEVEGPFGYFTPEAAKLAKKFVFIASGTGISPFHSLVKTHATLDYKILHGVKFGEESFDGDAYEKGRYIQCTSREPIGDFHGRVTDYIKAHPVDVNAEYYLCGNSNMIFDVFDLLKLQGVPYDQIHTEVYF